MSSDSFWKSISRRADELETLPAGSKEELEDSTCGQVALKDITPSTAGRRDDQKTTEVDDPH